MSILFLNLLQLITTYFKEILRNTSLSILNYFCNVTYTLSKNAILSNSNFQQQFKFIRIPSTSIMKFVHLGKSLEISSYALNNHSYFKFSVFKLQILVPFFDAKNFGVRAVISIFVCITKKTTLFITNSVVL